MKMSREQFSVPPVVNSFRVCLANVPKIIKFKKANLLVGDEPGNTVKINNSGNFAARIVGLREGGIRFFVMKRYE